MEKELEKECPDLCELDDGELSDTAGGVATESKLRDEEIRVADAQSNPAIFIKI